MTWDPVFNQYLIDKFGCVASEEFSQDGLYNVDRLKANLTMLSILGCSNGDTWDGIKPIYEYASESESGTGGTSGGTGNSGTSTGGASSRENDNLYWFKSIVQEKYGLPLLLKGIAHPADAAMAVRMGVDGIIVSNHGGRQVDGAISTIESLPGMYRVCIVCM